MVAASLQPFALLEHGHLYLDEYFTGSLEGDVSEVYRYHGHVLSKYSSAPGLCLVPFDLLPGLARVNPSDLFLHQSQKIGASFMVALSALFLMKALLFFLSRKEAVFLTAAYALGTSAFSVSSQAIWQHGPAQLFLCLGLWLLIKDLQKKRKDPKDTQHSGVSIALSGFAFAMASWCRYTNVVFPIGVLLFMAFRHRQKFIWFLSGLTLPFLALALDNIAHTGVPWSTGYRMEESDFSTPIREGLFGILFSPSRGLFTYSPFMFFSFYGFFTAWREKNQELLRLLSFSTLALILITAKWHSYGGGTCFGPRLLADLDPVLVFACVPVVFILNRRKWGFCWCLAASISILIHFMGVYLSWKWEAGDNLWSPARHPIFFFLTGGDATEVLNRVLLSAATVMILLAAGWLAFRWSKYFRHLPAIRLGF